MAHRRMPDTGIPGSRNRSILDHRSKPCTDVSADLLRDFSVGGPGPLLPVKDSPV